MQGSYWSSVMQKRLNRRRALAVAGGGAAGAALLAACGGDDDDKGASLKDTSGLLTTPELTQGKVGKTWPFYQTQDVVHFDPMTPPAGFNAICLYAHSQIVKAKTGTPSSLPVGGTFVGDAAQSWERTPDGLQITFKVRPNVKLDPRPPTNGRALEANDFVYSWNKFVSSSPSAGELSSKLDPNAPYESFTAVDKSTVTLKLAYPYVPALELLADYRYTYVIVGVEHESQYNPKQEMRGSGPWMMTNYIPSARIEFRRNPGYWDTPRPYFDGIDMPLLTEYAQRLAQFRTGNLWTVHDIRAEDMLSLKKDIPKLNLFANQNHRLSAQYGGPTPWNLGFSYLPDSPFNDIRVRQATSMLLDREGMMDTFYNISAFKSQGIDVSDYRLHTLVSCTDDRFWYDPKSRDFGDGAKNLEYNPDEAGKLFKAAGVQGVDLPFNVAVNFLATQGNLYPAIIAMLSNGGYFNVSQIVNDVPTWITKLHTAHGLFKGMVANPGGSSADPDLTMTRYYGSSNFRMFPEKAPYDDLLQKQRREFDVSKRQAIWRDIQKEWAKQVTDLVGPMPGVAKTLRIAWPSFANYGAVLPYTDNYPIEVYPHYWYDESKA